jgi:small subunit ribosomal protein S20
MPNTKSAKKALRSSLKKREYNLATKRKVRDSLKDLRKVIAINPENYQTALSKAYSSLDKAVKTNFLHKKTADRKKSRLAKMIDKVVNPKV